MTTVFLHPVGLDGECWSLTGLRGEMPSLPGHGDSPIRDLAGYSLDDMADWVIETYLGALDLVGLSMGGKIAQHIGIRHPGRVRSLMICCSSATGPSAAAAAVMSDERAESTLRLGMSGMMASTLDRWFGREAIEAPDDPGVAYVRRRLTEDDPINVAATWLLLRQSGLGERLHEITAPTTVFGARQDKSATVDKVVELSQAIPGSRLEIIDGPHMVMLERPAAFAAAVQRHVAWADETFSSPTSARAT